MSVSPADPSFDRRIAALRERLRQQSRYALVAANSPAMTEVLELIERVAETDVPILISGESGTGKELVARAIHAVSSRRDRPFVKVNCAALPAELLESELFGFERGAFTGAIQQKPGKFEFANLGTMFLDEIGDMSFPLQAKLLHVLQDGEFSRLGGRSDLRVDVRIVAATNRNLEEAVTAGQFRQDLFFRLNVVSIPLPPLRERRADIAVLADYFMEKFAEQYNKPAVPFSSATLQLFLAHDWPGNVRELENVIKRTVILGTETPVQRELQHAVAGKAAQGSAPASGAPRAPSLEPAPGPPPGAATMDIPAAPGKARINLKEVARAAAREAERAAILQTLQRTRWNRKEAAGLLGISYKALLYKIKENGLDKLS